MMKNILFYYDNYCDKSSPGGTEVATYRIAKALKESGECEIYHAYRSDVEGADPTFYKASVKLLPPEPLFVRELADFIRENEIDVVVNEGKFFRHKKLAKAIEKSGRETQLFFMHHFAPGSEKKKTTYKAAWHLLKLNPYNPVYYLRLLFYPLIRLPRTLNWKPVYKKVYDASQKIVLLSEGYKKEYCKNGGFKEENKFSAIPNIFAAASFVKPVAEDKKKHVLILSRMDEIQKRISLALKIWEKIEENPALNEWHLDIVGDGHNIDVFKRLAKKLKLNRVTFHGWKQSLPFLKESAILMSTSDYEGLSLAMIEAQSQGCVPIAFNSYASLKDVIEDRVNGVIVKNPGDINEFTEKLSALMLDSAKRETMARNAIESVDKFSSEKIAEKWLKILT